jgi:hypothetical protein
MDIREEFGLRIGLLRPDEALAGGPAVVPPDVTLLRVPDPPRDLRPALTELGYVHKPAWISWISEVCESEQAWLARLPRAHAQAIRRARRRLGDDIRIECRQPVPEHLLDEFLVLYEDMISRMPSGVPYAVSQREDILNNEKNFIIHAQSSEGMVGACICRVAPEEDTVVMRFPAYSPKARSDSLSRVLYMEVMRAAREMNHRFWSLGRDPNLYGHISKAGLFEFKARRLGFTPYATEPPFGIVPWTDESDLIVSSAGLSDPALMLGYPDEESAPGDEPRFVLEVFGDAGRLDALGSLGSLPFVTGVRLHPLGPGLAEGRP